MLKALIVICAAALGASFTAGAADTNSLQSGRARILIVTGDDYPGHHWRETAPEVASILREDKRLDVFIAEDPKFLDSEALHNYDAVILHFQNWQKPGPGDNARRNLEAFVTGGKGIVLTHLACGAWQGEWPDFVKLAGRVWFGETPPQGRRQHDPHGTFKVDIKPGHPLAKGLESFETRDELYTCLIGETPIHVLASAKSSIDQQEYPIAFTLQPGKGRSFHCVLGHDAAAWKVPGARKLLLRGVTWAAGLAP